MPNFTKIFGTSLAQVPSWHGLYFLGRSTYFLDESTYLLFFDTHFTDFVSCEFSSKTKNPRQNLMDFVSRHHRRVCSLKTVPGTV